jgi:hypothetical protein
MEGIVKISPCMVLNGTLGPQLFLLMENDRCLFPGDGSRERWSHSSILYLRFHNCFYSDRVLGSFFSFFSFLSFFSFFFFFFGTTNKEARGWVWEENYLNVDTVIEIHPSLERETRRGMDEGETSQTFVSSQVLTLLSRVIALPSTLDPMLLDKKAWLVIIIALSSASSSHRIHRTVLNEYIWVDGWVDE